ncbi:phosphoribosylamine--glycine ligase [Helicobacter labacensis]|uniref:phosphoribosylamine--glycine ligase n=1 Tax=Helicobacter labacensis TaxID=2316079 RepID=UPI000EB1134E|nr:phosphoribosylamine--glycine ligase [Helicobacter labacensis]
MKIAIIGSGGREHAIIKKISPQHQLFAIPGNAGMGVPCLDIPVNNTQDILAFAKREQLDFIIVAPDNPLVAGLVDVLEDAGFACFGPRKSGAQLEGSKIFAKEFMQRHHIPTAPYHAFSCFEEAVAFLSAQKTFPIVIKADGLAFGKGVRVISGLEEGLAYLKALMVERVFGESGAQVLIEEFLEGREASVLAFCDGITLKPMLSAMDYKRALEGNRGLNTGGMGCIAPNPYFTPQIAKECQEKIFAPTLRGIQADKLDFRGCLYFGLMLTDQGVKVVEYNCRFGDPEAQTLFPLLQSDLLEIMQACAKQKLAQQEVRFAPDHACCVVLTSQGYPQDFEVGHALSYPPELDICFAGVKRTQEGLCNASGRVLSITSTAPTLQEARALSYARMAKISLKNGYYRQDIGQL